MTTCEEATIGLAMGWPCTEMPYSTSVPITRRTLMERAYAVTSCREPSDRVVVNVSSAARTGRVGASCA